MQGKGGIFMNAGGSGIREMVCVLNGVQYFFCRLKQRLALFDLFVCLHSDDPRQTPEGEGQGERQVLSRAGHSLDFFTANSLTHDIIYTHACTVTY